MGMRKTALGLGIAGGVGLAGAVGLAQPNDPIPIPVIKPVSLDDMTPPAGPPPLPPIAPVPPPVQVPAEPAKVPPGSSGATPWKKDASSGTLKPSAAPRSSADALPRMLAEARTAYARLRDYSCHYIRQEKVSGRLVPEETCELRVRTNPFSISVKVTAPKDYANRETVYISTRHGGKKVRFKETNKLAYATLSMDDPKVLADTRHAIADVGLAAVLDRVENAVRVEKRIGNPVQVLVSDYSFAGKHCTRYEVFADRPHALRYAYRHVLYIDRETKLPVRYEAYDQPSAAGPADGDLIESQSFVGLRINTGLGEAAFER